MAILNSYPPFRFRVGHLFSVGTWRVMTFLVCFCTFRAFFFFFSFPDLWSCKRFDFLFPTEFASIFPFRRLFFPRIMLSHLGPQWATTVRFLPLSGRLKYFPGFRLYRSSKFVSSFRTLSCLIVSDRRDSVKNEETLTRFRALLLMMFVHVNPMWRCVVVFQIGSAWAWLIYGIPRRESQAPTTLARTWNSEWRQEQWVNLATKRWSQKWNWLQNWTHFLPQISHTGVHLAPAGAEKWKQMPTKMLACRFRILTKASEVSNIMPVATALVENGRIVQKYATRRGSEQQELAMYDNEAWQN